jgi:hypothetical protein
MAFVIHPRKNSNGPILTDSHEEKMLEERVLDDYECLMIMNA